MREKNVPRLIEIPQVGSSEMGHIQILDGWDGLPFIPKRVYWTTGVPVDTIRGQHAHKTLWQLIVAVSGELELQLENPKGKVGSFVLNRRDVGLVIPPMHWRAITFSAEAVLLCLASELYLASDYIRDYSEFKSMHWKEER